MGNLKTAIITLKWDSHDDERTCKICRGLDNYQWVFIVGKDVMTDALWHPVHGIVWSLAEGSNAHSRGYLSGHNNNCRCEMEESLDLEDILAKCVFLKETIESFDQLPDVQTGSRTSRGSSRSTTFDDIGIDASKYGFE